MHTVYSCALRELWDVVRLPDLCLCECVCDLANHTHKPQRHKHHYPLDPHDKHKTTSHKTSLTPVASEKRAAPASA